jgi:hypothetical protein
MFRLDAGRDVQYEEEKRWHMHWMVQGAGNDTMTRFSEFISVL